MIQLRKFLERFAALRGVAPLRQIRYAALVLAIAGLTWSGFLLASTKQREEEARVKSAELRRAVSDLKKQIARQQPGSSAPKPAPVLEDPTAEGLVARVGEAARVSGMRLAQARVVATPVSAQPPAAPTPPAGQPAPTTPPPAPVDPGGVEFHLTGSYGALRSMMSVLGESRSKFQVVTLDVMRTKVAPVTGTAQLDVRLVCIL